MLCKLWKPEGHPGASPFHSDCRGCGPLTQIVQTLARFCRMRQVADRVNPIVHPQAPPKPNRHLQLQLDYTASTGAALRVLSEPRMRYITCAQTMVWPTAFPRCGSNYAQPQSERAKLTTANVSHQLVAISNSLAWPTMRSERRSALADGLFNGDLERRGSWMATAPLPPSWPSRTPSSFRSLVVASVRVRKAQNAHSRYSADSN